MKITEIFFREPKLGYNPELLVYADIVLDGLLKLRDIQVCQGGRGFYICFPSRRIAEKNYYNMFFPLNKEFNQYLETEIIKEFSRK